MMSLFAKALSQVFDTLFGENVVECCDYWSQFDDLWKEVGWDEPTTRPTAPADANDTPLILIDSGKGFGEWSRWTTPFDWALTQLLRSARAGVAGSPPRYLIAPSNGDSRKSLYNDEFLTVLQAALPWIQTCRPETMLADCVRWMNKPLPQAVPPGLIDSVARIRLDKLLSPTDRHHVSNILAPLLIWQGFYTLYQTAKPSRTASLRYCLGRILAKDDRSSSLQAVAKHINAAHQREIIAGQVFRLDSKSSQSANLPEDVWPRSPLSPKNPVGVLLVDDCADAGFVPLLQFLLLGSAGSDGNSFSRDAKGQDGLSVHFDATNHAAVVEDAITQFEMDANTYGEQKLFRILYRDRYYDALFLDLRLSASDNSDENLQNLTGLRLARRIADLDPSFPIVLFSSSQQQAVYDQVKDSPNIVTTFRKPTLTGYQNTYDPDLAGRQLLTAAQRVTSLLKMRFLYQWLCELREKWRSVATSTVKSGEHNGLPQSHNIELSSRTFRLSWPVTVVDRLTRIFQQYLQRGFYMESWLYCFQFVEIHCDLKKDPLAHNTPTFSPELIGRVHEHNPQPSQDAANRFKLAVELMKYSRECRNLAAHQALRVHRTTTSLNLEDEAIFSFAIALTWTEQLLLGMVCEPIQYTTPVLNVSELWKLAKSQRQKLPKRVGHFPQSSMEIRLACYRASVAEEVWNSGQPWNGVWDHGLLRELHPLWLRMLECDAQNVALT